MLLIGSLTLIGGCGALGLWIAHKIRSRPQEIREFIVALTLLDTEILYNSTPLPEAFANISLRMKEPWQSFFRALKHRIENGEGAGEAWENTIASHKKHTNLKEDDWQIIASLGKGLGRSDRQEQHKHITLILHQLELACEQSAKWADNNARMWSYLGFLTGTGLVILLI